jgi:hypothetical protein
MAGDRILISLNSTGRFDLSTVSQAFGLCHSETIRLGLRTLAEKLEKPGTADNSASAELPTPAFPWK